MVDRFRRRLAGTLAAAIAMLLLSPQVGEVARLPDHMVLGTGAVMEIPVSAAVSAGFQDADGTVAGLEKAGNNAVRVIAGEPGEASLVFRLLGLLPVRTVRVSVQPERRLVPGGQSVGVALNIAGVVVVGNSDLGSTPSPARKAGLKSGDVIQRVNDEPVTGALQLSQCLSDGKSARLQVLRDGREITCDVTPALDVRDGRWRLGAWVRDSTAGVGTLTFYDPETGWYGALGHAITDVDTGVLMPVGEGELYENSVVSVTRSREGTPGELTGDFLGEASGLGALEMNSEHGIFGTADAPLASALYPEGLPVASRAQIHTGPATLLTTVEGSAVREYACEIVRISDRGDSASRAMVVRVTDPALIERTGGIVQGMSGSPLIQDGRIIGALTHVMVSDPTMGYGVAIETMLEASDSGSAARATLAEAA